MRVGRGRVGIGRINVLYVDTLSVYYGSNKFEYVLLERVPPGFRWRRPGEASQKENKHHNPCPVTGTPPLSGLP